MKTNIIVPNGEISYQYEQSGAFAFMCRDQALISQVSDRHNVALKIFFRPLSTNETLESYVWGRSFPIVTEEGLREENSTLGVATRIQNLCAQNGLAPFVYGLGIVKYKGENYPFQLMQWLDGNAEMNQDNRKSVYNSIAKLGEELGFYIEFEDLGVEENVMAGKLIDFQGFRFRKNYQQRVIKRVKDKATWAGNYYQNFEGEIGYKGVTRVEKLNKALHNKLIDFKGKVVMDIGCNGGEFLRFAAANGAIRCIGIDLPEVIPVAMEAANYSGYFDIDWIPKVIQKDEDIGLGCDVLFFTSMKLHVGIPPILFRTPTVVYEHNGDDLEGVLQRFSENNFEVIDLGPTGVEDERHTYIMQMKLSK